MKYRSLLTLAAFIPMLAWAREIDSSEARAIAAGFFSRSGIECAVTEPVNAPLSTSEKAQPYYVFNAGKDNGFVIVAGDDRLGSVLGYADSGSFTLDGAPDGLKALMKLYEQYMLRATASTVTSPAEAGTPVVEPLLREINWGQDTPFNTLCPTYTQSGTTKNYYTGCVVTAATQIMKYYNYPATGTGSHSYTFGGKTLTADFANTSYNWNAMPEAVPDVVSVSQTKAYSTLASHFGIAVEMQYAVDGSGAYTMMVPAALRNYFGYDAALRLHPREYYSSAEWMAMIKSELDAGRPVYYGASSDSGMGGHAFVCDGYDSNGYVHINWGWYGRSNGYFLVNHLDPSSLGEGGGTGGYNRQQEIITGIRPAVAGSTKAVTLYGATRLSCVDYGNAITLMSYIENLDTEAVTGKAGALLMKNGEVVKVLGTQDLTISGFAAGKSGNVLMNMRDVSSDATGVTDGSGYTVRMGVLADGQSEWTVLRHPIGLPSYISASVKSGKVVIESSHVPAPDVVLLAPVATDGALYVNGSGLFHLELENRSADYRLKNIVIRLTSVADASVTAEMESPVNIYDLSTESVDLLMELPADMAAGDYFVTAYEKGFPDNPFDDTAVGRTRVTVLPEADAPVIRLTSQPYWHNSDGVQDVAQGEYLYIGASARNYGPAGNAQIISRLTDVNNPERSYIFIMQEASFKKGASANLAFYRKVTVDPGQYHAEFSVIDSEGRETPLEGDYEPVVVNITDRSVPDIEVLSLDMPENLAIGTSGRYNLTVKALKDFSGYIFVRLRQYNNKSGEIVYMGSQRLSAGEEKTLTFTYRPAVTEGRYMVIVESRPSGVASGNENQAGNIDGYYRLIKVADAASIDGIDSDSGVSVTAADGKITVTGANAVRSISVYDIAGRLVARSNGSDTLVTGHLASGTYIVNVLTDKVAVRKKLILK